MNQVGMREFRTHISAIVRRVRENGESFEITRYGKVVAILRPIQPWEKERPRFDKPSFEERWAEHMALAEEIGKHWTGELSAVEAVAEQRRDLADPAYWKNETIQDQR